MFCIIQHNLKADYRMMLKYCVMMQPLYHSQKYKSSTSGPQIYDASTVAKRKVHLLFARIECLVVRYSDASTATGSSFCVPHAQCARANHINTTVTLLMRNSMRDKAHREDSISTYRSYHL